MPFWLLHGRAYFKQQLAKRVNIAADTLPYNPAVLAYLQQAHAAGRPLILVTASDKLIAEVIAKHLGIFSQVLASDGKINLSGKTKCQVLNQQFGQGQYDYLGDHHRDIAVWQHCHQALTVKFKLTTKHCQTKVCQHFPGEVFRFKDFLQTIRIHQYAKNLLIFLPLLLSHELGQLHLVINCILGFVAFCLFASSAYLVNDLFDLESDRRHHAKRHRALAAGRLSIQHGILLAVTLFILAGLIALQLASAFGYLLLLYYVLTLAYSINLKRHALIDVIVLSGLYTLRILAGMTLIVHGYSDWLILFSLFFFTSLAFAKRYAELHHLSQRNLTHSHGRGYHTGNLAIIKIFGIASGYISLLVLALYLNSEQATRWYAHPRLLYAICPILLYWLSLIWLQASEGKLHEDPVVHALKDKVSWTVVILVIIVALIATVSW
jgi:4-hydroxybenzoate polyprenyltransferase